MTNDGSKDYSFDADNRLTAQPSGAVTLAYDPTSRLSSVVQGATTTRFLYDGADLIAEYNGSGALLRRYVHGPGVDDPIVWLEGTGTSDRRWLAADERGSVLAATNVSGALVGTLNRYDTYGIPAAANTGRFQYTGQLWIPELALYHYKARVYHPRFGRFLQTDPIRYGDGMNLYAYAHNDPLNGLDPSGQRCESNDGTTVCTPEDPSFEPFSFPTPEGWTDFEPGDFNYHAYRFEDDAGAGDESYGQRLEEELVQSPTNDENAATLEGQTNNVGPLVTWSGEDNVTSYTTSDGIANVTQNDHFVRYGFVARKIEPDGEGGYRIVTYGEGNNWVQKWVPGAEEGARNFWTRNADRIVDRARQQ